MAPVERETFIAAVVMFVAAPILVAAAPDKERTCRKLEVPAARTAAEAAARDVRQREVVEHFGEWSIPRTRRAAVLEDP